MRAPAVSVVIPTRGEQPSLSRCLAAIAADAAAAEIIVARDDDADSTTRVLADAREPRLRVLPPPGVVPTGPGATRARGVAAAGGDVVLAIDDDVVAHRGLVSGHAARHAAGEPVVVLGYMPVVLPPRGAAGRGAARLYAEGYERACAAYEVDPSLVLRRLWGGNLSLPREHWPAAGTPGLELRYHEDEALGRALLGRGLRGVFERALRADHWFRRPVERMVGDAARAADARRTLAELYPDAAVPGPRPLVSSALRALRPLLSREQSWSALEQGGTAAIGFASRRRHEAAEYVLTRALWRLAYERGSVAR